MDKTWQDSIVLITGGKRGIGKAFALQLAQLGCTVIISSRNTEADDVKQTLLDIHEQAILWSQASGLPVRQPLALQWDLSCTDPLKLNNLLKTNHITTIDVLVHAAHSISPYKLMHFTSPVEFSSSLQLNVVGTYVLLQVITRKMLRQRFGRILLVGSIASVMGGVGQVTYITEKAAIEGMMKAMCVEFADKNILVNAIHPGIVATENILSKMNASTLSQYKKLSPLNKLLTPHDIVQSSLSLINPSQCGITGQSINIVAGLDTAYPIYLLVKEQFDENI